MRARAQRNGSAAVSARPHTPADDELARRPCTGTPAPRRAPGPRPPARSRAQRVCAAAGVGAKMRRCARHAARGLLAAALGAPLAAEARSAVRALCAPRCAAALRCALALTRCARSPCLTAGPCGVCRCAGGSARAALGRQEERCEAALAWPRGGACGGPARCLTRASLAPGFEGFRPKNASAKPKAGDAAKNGARDTRRPSLARPRACRRHLPRALQPASR